MKFVIGVIVNFFLYYEPTMAILQRTTVDIGQIKIQGVATCLFLCMDTCGTVYGSKQFTDDCVFNESMEQHHYNTYSSSFHSNPRRILYLALNRQGQPRKIQIPATRPLGKLATYTKSLTQTVSHERVEKLITRLFGPTYIRHGLKQLCEAGNSLTELTEKTIKLKPKCNLKKQQNNLLKRKRNKRRCRPDEPENDSCIKSLIQTPSSNINRNSSNNSNRKNPGLLIDHIKPNQLQLSRNRKNPKQNNQQLKINNNDNCNKNEDDCKKKNQKKIKKPNLQKSINPQSSVIHNTKKPRLLKMQNKNQRNNNLRKFLQITTTTLPTTPVRRTTTKRDNSVIKVVPTTTPTTTASTTSTTSFGSSNSNPQFTSEDDELMYNDEFLVSSSTELQTEDEYEKLNTLYADSSIIPPLKLNDQQQQSLDSDTIDDDDIVDDDDDNNDSSNNNNNNDSLDDDVSDEFEARKRKK